MYRYLLIIFIKVLLALQVLTEPKNALGKQYKKLIGMNNVSNSFPISIYAHVRFLSLYSCGVKIRNNLVSS